MEKVGFFLRGFGFSSREDGGVDIIVRATDSSHSPIIRKLHMNEEELYEMLALLGIGEEDELELDGYDALERADLVDVDPSDDE